MLTDRPPARPALLQEFRKSDQLDALDIPLDDRLKAPAKLIENAMVAEDRKAVQLACAEFLHQASEFYTVTSPPVRVLAARPIRVREGDWGMELFGDYDPQTKQIRVWLRTAVLKHVTSFGRRTVADQLGAEGTALSDSSEFHAGARQDLLRHRERGNNCHCPHGQYSIPFWFAKPRAGNTEPEDRERIVLLLVCSIEGEPKSALRLPVCPRSKKPLYLCDIDLRLASNAC